MNASDTVDRRHNKYVSDRVWAELTGVKPRIPVAMEDEEYNVFKMRSAMSWSLNQLFTHIYAESTSLPETDTPRRKKIRRLSFIIGSCYLFLIEIVLENVRFICRGIIGLFYEVLRVNRCK